MLVWYKLLVFANLTVFLKVLLCFFREGMDTDKDDQHGRYYLIIKVYISKHFIRDVRIVVVLTSV